MRVVHEVVFLKFHAKRLIELPEDPIIKENPPVPVAFIQWGNREDGFQYEGVCVFCAQSIGWVDPQGDAQELAKGLATCLAIHKVSCSRFGMGHDVRKARPGELLRTEKLPTVN